MTEPAGTTMRRDIASAYVVTAARVLSWVVVSAIVFRKLGAESFAMLALVRATIGLLGYVSLGIGPAMVRLLSLAEREPVPVAAISDASIMPVPASEPQPAPLAYAQTAAPAPPSDAIARVYATGERVAIALAAIGLALAAAYAMNLDWLHKGSNQLRDDARVLALSFGVGIVFRVISEAPAGLLQVRGRIALDNLLLAAAEVVWAVGTSISFMTGTPVLFLVGFWFLAANFALLGVRAGLGRLEVRTLTTRAGRFDGAVAKQLLSFGLLVVVAQLADFLYAPTAYILINRLIDPAAVAVYAPAVQIDASLLLLVMGVAAVMLPKTAIAHAAGDVALVRRYYVRATLLTAGMLLLAAVAVWALAPWIFQLWLGEPMTETQAILPLVLIHTVVGGSAAVGRSVLLGIGKVRPLTTAVLAAGAGNVVLGYVFIAQLDLGVRGMVYATVIVVVLRAAVWMPWYIWRTLRQSPAPSAQSSQPVSQA